MSLDVQLIDKAAPKIDENNWDDMKRKWFWSRFQIYYKDWQSGSNVMSMFNVRSQVLLAVVTRRTL